MNERNLVDDHIITRDICQPGEGVSALIRPIHEPHQSGVRKSTNLLLNSSKHQKKQELEAMSNKFKDMLKATQTKLDEQLAAAKDELKSEMEGVKTQLRSKSDEVTVLRRELEGVKDHLTELQETSDDTLKWLSGDVGSHCFYSLNTSHTDSSSRINCLIIFGSVILSTSPSTISLWKLISTLGTLFYVDLKLGGQMCVTATQYPLKIGLLLLVDTSQTCLYQMLACA